MAEQGQTQKKYHQTRQDLLGLPGRTDQAQKQHDRSNRQQRQGKQRKKERGKGQAHRHKNQADQGQKKEDRRA